MSYLDDFFDKRKQLRQAQAALSPEQQKAAEEQAVVEQRNKALNYKKFFGETHQREVMLDLMNKHIMAPGDPKCACCARKDMVVDLLTRANLSMEQLDKILKGEF